MPYIMPRCTHARQKNFHHLANLRVVHFRYMRQRGSVSKLGRTPRQVEVTADIQRFANTVLAYMDHHGICPKLQGIIFGMHWELEEPLADCFNDGWCYTRHCFVKCSQTDPLGRTTPVAVLVPAYRLRELEPECELLDLDPECEWASDWPTRLRE
jgi:hypothetical protein